MNGQSSSAHVSLASRRTFTSIMVSKSEVTVSKRKKLTHMGGSPAKEQARQAWTQYSRFRRFNEFRIDSRMT
jgi:hypothetical protein